NERFKVQATNDFLVFFTQAMASLFAGIILFNQGWNQLVSITIPVILLMFIMTFWFYRLKVDSVD
ncbi:MAG: MFS transporter, partial [Gammaproteobacteria bacterium]